MCELTRLLHGEGRRPWGHEGITSPDFIVETGTFRGGSAALWAMVLQQINPEGRVITIDIEDWS